jgi:RNA polymerase sigma factor (sigma-70 family)
LEIRWPSLNWWIKTACYEDNEVVAPIGVRYEAMATSPLNKVIQHVLADFGPGGGGMTDGELLVRFLKSRDQDAVAGLVRRHAPMVWGVCCRLLYRPQDAEDAFQATFLVLVKKAADVPRQAVANWLYGVARQTAVRLRATTAKRGRREMQVMNMPELEDRSQGSGVRSPWDDVRPLLDLELGRLPDKYRGVIVLCDLEGMTRKEAARQLGIPEGSVASRLARARVMLAKRLTQRGVVFSGGSVTAVLSAGSGSAPPALVASTIKAASLLAAGRAAGVVSAKVAALTDGVVKAMFTTKVKSVLAVVLVVAALAGATGLLYQTQAGEQPMAKEEQPAARKDKQASEEKQAQPKQQPAKTDQERIVGSWVIVNEDSNRKGEPWSISKDKLCMHTNYKYYNYRGYWIDPPVFVYRLDAGKTPKQIDIGVTKDSVRIKGIYVLDGDELRLCLGQPDKDRPAAFPEKSAPGEVLILQRQKPAAEQPKAKGEVPAAKKVLTPEEAIKLMSKENVTVQFKVASVEVTGPYVGFGGPAYYIYLKDGGRFYARLIVHDSHEIKKLGIERVTDLSGKVVRVTGRVEPSGDTSFMMWVRDLNNIEVVKE